MTAFDSYLFIFWYFVCIAYMIRVQSIVCITVKPSGLFNGVDYTAAK